MRTHSWKKNHSLFWDWSRIQLYGDWVDFFETDIKNEAISVKKCHVHGKPFPLISSVVKSCSPIQIPASDLSLHDQHSDPSPHIHYCTSRILNVSCSSSSAISAMHQLRLPGCTPLRLSVSCPTAVFRPNRRLLLHMRACNSNFLVTKHCFVRFTTNMGLISVLMLV